MINRGCDICIFLDVMAMTHLQQQLHDVKVELDAEREAKSALDSKHRALTDDHKLLAK